jgi:hypothetical protein
MRLHGAIGTFLVHITLIVAEAAATPFQNLDFEAWPGQAPMPGWQLVMQEYDGTLLYQGADNNPMAIYPFYGEHIGFGPIIAVNGWAGSFPTTLPPIEGQYSISLRGSPHNGTYFATRPPAEAAMKETVYGGVAQTAVVPATAKSVWIATLGVPDMFFNNFPVALSAATNSQALAMLAQESMDSTFLTNNPSIKFYAGNIETISNLTRELKLLPRAYVSVIGAEPAPLFGYEVFSGGASFDKIVFSSLAWDGPAVNVPEPASVLLLGPAIAVLRRRRAAG